ncbi:MAG: DUF885 domain-containing protein [Deltaproteobacteria bacterium]|nr:DUF885 domain-containing protein [Deltaproteobacteria bacterium]
MYPKFGLLSSLLIAMMILMSTATGAGELSMNASAKALHALFRAEWDYRMEQNPTWASVLGDRRWNDRWPDLSLAAIRKRQEHNIEALAKLKSIERRQLSRQDQLSYDLFQKEYEIKIEQHQYGLYFIPLNQLGGIQTANEVADALRFETLKDYEDWTARLRALPVYMDQTIALMREGMSTRIVLPKIILQRVPAQIDKQIVEAPEASPFYKPFKQFSTLFSTPDRERLVESAKRAIASEVIPAYRRFKGFFVTKYIPASFDQVGAWQMTNGGPLYAFLARKYTTTSLTPKEIHEIGLREVKRIRGEMEAIIDKVGFKGTFAEFLEFLRSDPRFYYKTPDELLAAYQTLTRRIDPHLVKLFKTLPRMPYGVEPIPAAIAADTTTAYYRSPAADGSRAGTYFVNIYKPEVRPRYEMMALSLHEAVPGHHLQIALAMEQDGLPNFRRYNRQSA